MPGFEWNAPSVGGGGVSPAELTAVSGNLQNQIDDFVMGPSGEVTAAYVNAISGYFEAETNILIADVAALTSDLAGVSGEVAENGLSISSLLTDLAAQSGYTEYRMDAIETDIATNVSDISDNDDAISTLQTDLAGISGYFETETNTLFTDFAALSSDLTGVSGMVEQNVADIAALQSDLSAVSGYFEIRADAADAGISTNAGTISFAQTHIVNVSGYFEAETNTLFTDFNSLSSDLTGVSGMVDQNEADIAQLASDLSDFSGYFEIETNTNASDIGDLQTGQAFQDTHIANVSGYFETETDTVFSQISALDGVLSSLSTHVGNVSGYFEAETDALQSDVSTNTTDIGSLSTHIGNVSGYLEAEDTMIYEHIDSVSGYLEANAGGGVDHLIVQGRLDFISNTKLSFRPFNGQVVYNPLNGQTLSLADEPHYITTTGTLTSLQMYNVYLDTAESSASGATGYRLLVNQTATGVTDGITHMNGDTDNLHVGWCVPSGGVFRDNNIDRLVRSRFNKYNTACSGVANYESGITANGNWQSLSIKVVASYIITPGDEVSIYAYGTLHHTAGNVVRAGISINDTVYEYDAANASSSWYSSLHCEHQDYVSTPTFRRIELKYAGNATSTMENHGFFGTLSGADKISARCYR